MHFCNKPMFFLISTEIFSSSPSLVALGFAVDLGFWAYATCHLWNAQVPLLWNLVSLRLPLVLSGAIGRGVSYFPGPPPSGPPCLCCVRDYVMTHWRSVRPALPWACLGTSGDGGGINSGGCTGADIGLFWLRLLHTSSNIGEGNAAILCVYPLYTTYFGYTCNLYPYLQLPGPDPDICGPVEVLASSLRTLGHIGTSVFGDLDSHIYTILFRYTFWFSKLDFWVHTCLSFSVSKATLFNFLFFFNNFKFLLFS